MEEECLKRKPLHICTETENTEAEEDQTPASVICHGGRMVDIASGLKTFFNLHLFALNFEPDCTCRAGYVFELY